MKPNELRLKNLFQTNKKDLLECSELTAEGIVFTVVDRSKYPLEYKWQAEPIPLTEEWLLKLGFEKKPNCYKNVCFSIDVGEDHSLEVYEDNSWTIQNNKEMEYFCYSKELFLNSVHKLQNLYFALKGEELTIK